MSSSFNQSSSSSSTVPIQTAQNNIMDQIAATASGMAQNLYSWASNTFAQTSAITNQAVGNFFNVSQQMNGLSNSMTGQYNNLFAPENAQLVADANSYASPARMATDMGMAGATQAQAGQAALGNSEAALRSYGIDPSAGRYAALDKAAAVQNAANVAGAENTQRMADIATGQQLRSQAVQVGAQLPAAIANVNNTAIQANTGASNATLANANTGANMFSVPDKYLATGMQVKLPFSASSGSSQSSGSSSSPDKSSSGSGSGSGGGGSGGGGGGYSGGSSNMQANDTSAWGNAGGVTYGGGQQPNAGVMSGLDTNSNNPLGQAGLTDTSTAGGYGDMSSGGGGYSDTSGGYSDYSGGGDYARGGPIMMQEHGPQSQPTMADSANSGAIDTSLSPSGGQKVDDVQAAGPGNSNIHLNANEFVIPQDVALWKGQEFFQNLINGSRKARLTASAKPTPNNAPTR